MMCLQVAGQSSPALPPLLDAIERNDIDTARKLLDRGADVNQRDKIGDFSALHLAARNGNKGIVVLLLERGAVDSKSKIVILGKSGKLEGATVADLTAAELADVRGHTEVAQLIRRRARRWWEFWK